MLSRLHDERVFTGSHDVVFSDASAREAQQRLLGATPKRMRRQLGTAEHKREESDGDDASSGGERDDSDEDDEEDDEDELMRNSRHPPSARYHPQHPYNAQLLMLATKKNQQQSAGGTLVRNGGKACVLEHHHPMEFVFLPNGEIRPRDECPPGLVLPPPVTHASLAAEEESQHSNHLLAEDAYEDRGGTHQQQQHLGSASAAIRRSETSDRGVTTAAKSTAAAAKRPGANIAIVGYTKKERTSRRSRSSSESSESSDSSSPARYQSSAAKRRHSSNNNVEALQRDESSASDASDGDSPSSDSEDEEEKENARQQPGGARRTTLKQRVVERSSAKRADAVTSRPVAAPATRSSTLNRNKNAEPDARKQKKQSETLRVQTEDHEEQLKQSNSIRGKAPSQPHQPGAREKHQKAPLPSPSSASDASQSAWSRRLTAVKYRDLQAKPTQAEAAKQQKKSTKMDVRDLLSENSRVKVLKSKPSREQSEKIEFLEQELQKEKKRVLEKMAQLLEEQGKSQQLQHQVDVLQSQLASKERDAEVKVKEVLKSKDESLGHVEAQWKARVKALEEQLYVKDAAVARWQSESEQLKHTIAKLKDREHQSSSQSKDKEASANHQFEKILAKLKKFRARVEHWKTSSKEAMEVCDRKADLLSLMDTLWLDFPAFPSFLDANGDTKSSTGCEKGSENANMILFLKKRLRLREDELHQTHVKYSELKELCARQCVREADLQNFINEHRLRGNLVIRKDGTTPNDNNANDGRRNVQFQEQQQQQQRSETEKKSIVNRGTNTTPPTYYEEAESDEDNREEYDDEYEEDDEGGRAENYDEDEGEQQEEYYVREPKVFVQVGRDGVFEHTPPRSSAVLRKLEEDPARHARKKKEARDVERIRLVPSTTLARRYERVSSPADEYVVAATRRKAPGMSTPPRAAATSANRLVRPPSITRTSGVVRRKAAQLPSAGRVNGTRTMSVSSRVSRSASVPWV